MTTFIKILNNKDSKEFDTPPEFNGEERKQFFSLPKNQVELMSRFKTPMNKVGFVLQFGYFKAVNKFFVAHKFYKTDIIFVAKMLGLESDIDFDKYTKATFTRHQKHILEYFGIRRFDNDAKDLLQKEALILASKQIKPRLMFMSLVDFLKWGFLPIPPKSTVGLI